MAQSPIVAVYGKNPAGKLVSPNVDAEGNLIVASNTDGKTTLNITAATVIKASAGLVFRASVIVAGSAAGTINDCLTTGTAATANAVVILPNTVGQIQAEWPMNTGIVVVPGTGQTIALSWA